MSFLLEVKDLHKSFDVTRLEGWRTRRRTIDAVAGVSLGIRRGECLALIGESGSGKTTLARCIAGAHRPDRGRILFDGADQSQLGGAERRLMRRRVQMMFQDALAALNPRFTVRQTLDEALFARGLAQSQVVEDRHRLIRAVGLEESQADRYPHQLSGGQRQRVNLARALAMEPDLLVLDEPTSGLDASLRRQVLESLADLRKRTGMSHLVISHDLETAASADRVAVMYLGRVVEIGPACEVLRSPAHPYTSALLASRPSSRPGGPRWQVMQGEIPSAENPPSGCVFHPRCPRADERCSTEAPSRESSGGSQVACFHPLGAAGKDASADFSEPPNGG